MKTNNLKQIEKETIYKLIDDLNLKEKLISSFKLKSEHDKNFKDTFEEYIFYNFFPEIRRFFYNFKRQTFNKMVYDNDKLQYLKYCDRGHYLKENIEKKIFNDENLIKSEIKIKEIFSKIKIEHIQKERFKHYLKYNKFWNSPKEKYNKSLDLNKNYINCNKYTIDEINIIWKLNLKFEIFKDYIKIKDFESLKILKKLISKYENKPQYELLVYLDEEIKNEKHQEKKESKTKDYKNFDFENINLNNLYDKIKSEGIEI